MIKNKQITFKKFLFISIISIVLIVYVYNILTSIILEVDFRKPVPMDKEVTVTARAEEIGERKVILNMEMEVEGEVRARSKMVAVAVKDNM